jgi:hypothetical protein
MVFFTSNLFGASYVKDTAAVEPQAPEHGK